MDRSDPRVRDNVDKLGEDPRLVIRKRETEMSYVQYQAVMNELASLWERWGNILNRA